MIIPKMNCAIIQEVEKCEREEFGEERDGDVGGEESEDGDISDPDDDIPLSTFVTTCKPVTLVTVQ